MVYGPFAEEIYPWPLELVGGPSGRVVKVANL